MLEQKIALFHMLELVSPLANIKPSRSLLVVIGLFNKMTHRYNIFAEWYQAQLTWLVPLDLASMKCLWANFSQLSYVFPVISCYGLLAAVNRNTRHAVMEIKRHFLPNKLEIVESQVMPSWKGPTKITNPTLGPTEDHHQECLRAQMHRISSFLD